MELVPPLNTAVEKYTLEPIAISTLLPPRRTTTVTASADSAASMQIAENAQASGTASSPISLFTATSIAIVVTAPDRTTRKTYTVSVGGRVNDFIKASNTRLDSNFGYAVALSDDTLVVGAPLESTLGSGVFDNQEDKAEPGGVSHGGRVRLRKDGTRARRNVVANGVSQEPRTRTRGRPTTHAVDRGSGTPSHSRGTRWPWERSRRAAPRRGGKWRPERYSEFARSRGHLSGTHGDRSSVVARGLRQGVQHRPEGVDGFGATMALSGDTLVVSATQEQGDTSGINGEQFGGDHQRRRRGLCLHAEGHRKPGGDQQSYIKPSTTRADMAFESCSALSGNTLVVGAAGGVERRNGRERWPRPTNPRRPQAPHTSSRAADPCHPASLFKASNARAGANFGASIALSGDTLAVGATTESSLWGWAWMETRGRT